MTSPCITQTGKMDVDSTLTEFPELLSYIIIYLFVNKSIICTMVTPKPSISRFTGFWAMYLLQSNILSYILK